MSADPSHSFRMMSYHPLSLSTVARMGLTRIKRVMFYHPKLHTAKSAFAYRPAAADGSAFLMEFYFSTTQKAYALFQTYASEVSCYITLRETSSPERFAQAPAFISFTMPFIRLYSPSMRRRSSIFLVRRSLE